MAQRIVIENPADPAPAALGRAVAVLAAGGVVVFPTETFYGLAVDAGQPAALDRLVKIKGREPGKPIALILARAGEAEAWGEVGAVARRLGAAFWPGPLTLVLPLRAGLPAWVGASSLVSAAGGVGMRVSSHPVAAGLAAGLGRAITATSANRAGWPPARRPGELDPAILAAADLWLDAGGCPGGPASTVLDLVPGRPRLLRPGAVTAAALAAVLGAAPVE